MDSRTIFSAEVPRNEADHEIVIGEVKRNHTRINLHTLEEKAANIISKRKDWHVKFVALSLADMQ